MRADHRSTVELRSFGFDRLNVCAAVLDRRGVVRETNEAWRLVALLNDGTPGATGVGANYLDVCDRAAAHGDTAAAATAVGLRQILTDSGARMVVVREATAASSLAIPFLALSDAPTHPAEGFARPKVSSQQLAYVIYTSGSTGQPKGVCITHDTVTAFVRAVLEAEALTEGIRCAQYATLTFDAHVAEIWPALAVGGSVNFVPSESRLDARSFIEWLVRERIQRCFAPTPFAEHCFRVAWPACDLKVFIVGGDVLHGVREALPFCLKNYYGPTECTCAAVGCDVPPSADLAPIGRPFAGVRLYVLDRSLEPVPPAAPGELYIGGALVGRGYLGQSALTAEKFLPDPFSAEPGARMYRTGDLARLGPDGLAYFYGRLDDQVKLRGMRIELGEIEAAILESSSVREAIVVARAEDGGAKRLVAYIVALGDGAVAALRSELQAKLPLYMVPASFVVLPSLPRMSTGKVDRRALPAPTEPSSAPVADTSNSEIEDFVATIWREVLGVSSIHAHQSFFDLGGHSVTASQVIVRIRQLLGADLPVRALFDSPTVASFSRCVVEAMVKSLSAEAQAGRPAA